MMRLFEIEEEFKDIVINDENAVDMFLEHMIVLDCVEEELKKLSGIMILTDFSRLSQVTERLDWLSVMKTENYRDIVSSKLTEILGIRNDVV